MKLNKSQRHTAYIIMLAEAEENLSRWLCDGFCGMSAELFGIWPKTKSSPSDDTLTKVLGNFVTGVKWRHCYPELFSNGPKVKTLWWFTTDEPGWQKRIELLKKCIEETTK